MDEDFPIHRKRTELLAIFRYFAGRRDEEGFKEFLSDELNMQERDEGYAAALSAFWNLVRAIENERR